ncbi:hypothetical protein [Novosphingobium sp. B 225]|uniref:hypothetical protein n=1 Tax=Novosphingobium sp. B 225 TaxID=1961849 RepID=UPI000B4C1701|nr:hypothetical protein [Novosphingobium sp. B 225]
MRKGVIGAGLLLALGGGAMLQAAGGSPMAGMAGYYARTWQSGDVSGGKFDVTDEVVIEPIDAKQAKVSFALNFFNGHTCDLEGTATLMGNRLIYTDPDGWDGNACKLEIWRQGKDLRWTDRDNGCHSYCGMRGTFTDMKLALKYRKPLSARPKPREN